MENANKKTGPDRAAPPNTLHDKLFKVVFKRTH